MKTLLLLSALASLPAFAANTDTYDFRCKTVNPIEGKRHKGPTEFSFTVKITTAKASYVTPEETSDEPVKMSPADSILDLNDNGEIYRTKKGIKLVSDGDGFQDTAVELYEDAGYRTGYARVSLHEGGDEKGVYSPVACTVKERK